MRNKHGAQEDSQLSMEAWEGQNMALWADIEIRSLQKDTALAHPEKSTPDALFILLFFLVLGAAIYNHVQAIVLAFSHLLFPKFHTRIL